MAALLGRAALEPRDRPLRWHGRAPQPRYRPPGDRAGQGRRLPTRAELESLVCAECEGPKIDLATFPDTPADSFWTGDRNWIAPRHFWSVNFRTGHSYGRFFPYQDLAVRLVRDR